MFLPSKPLIIILFAHPSFLQIRFPDVDLTARKPWIKETVKQLVAAAP